ncbi:MAG: YciI family protein [Gammaproteobacteria bacterium]|nr:YciI family protein [Gammaproteobacteria bacterium]MCF6364535.1 YciI family protein [Gammaproteobacteria bacterium]
MLYAISSQFVDNCLEKCQQARPAGFSGSLIVVEFDSLQSAQTWADPYTEAGIYAQVTVKPFIQVFPK